jgi:hypothetical protein
MRNRVDVVTPAPRRRHRRRTVALLLGLGLSLSCGEATEGEACQRDDDCQDGLVCAEILCFRAPCPEAICTDPAR